ncbi:RING finger protein [Wickerhamomyces ciferrii]|uniref:RING finger protein n=1 Tax=Wickerhamomyces ciferrii (strain ATCC 14091 / BCRC 22168 / CBS 111 / JCM 3599 / NBRC 0793 / NRRL Y-1031 F-60-10) TaxID=1206466 RepID=K0KZK4_WICCF|nr:RING finger protein [Wickerhamomyces ciferrii]CCH46578.1 RING finger protein [Wickerhamomyces ciferrii]
MSQQGGGGSTSSQPSSILFFIAVAIGVVIAFVFIFFSMRYYVRTRLGIYATARLTTTSNNGGIVLLTGDFPMHTFNAYSQDLPNQLRRNRRRRRYLKKRRLTDEEVDHLFPVRTYQNWLDGGAERDADQRDIHKELKQEDDDEVNESNNDNGSQDDINNTQTQSQTETETQQKNNITTQQSDVESTYHDAIQDQPQQQLEPQQSKHSDQDQIDLGTPYEPHYDSGTCAICIDIFEPEDLVRGLICGHVFHQECLDPWLTKRKACCPMCKRDYYLKNENQDGDENGETNDDRVTDVGGIAGGANNEDLDSINQFTELQYTTLNERVQEILSRHPNLEQIAKDKIQRYLKFKWRIFWIIMGISRNDLINSAIVNEDQRLRDEDPNYDNDQQPTTNTTEVDEGENQNQQQNQQNSDNRERVERMV